jgi:uncharacterized membrane protein YczE
MLTVMAIRVRRRQVVPRVRGGLWARAGVLVAGLFVFAAGIVALLESGLGLSPWDVLHDGLAARTGLSFGAASVVVSLLVLVLAWSLGAPLGVGTVANAVLVGAFVEALAAIGAVERLADAPLAARLLLLAAGVLLMAAGTALYLGAGFGAGPRDSLMVVGAERLRARVGLVRSVLELSVLGAGVALGGTVGIGTIVFALGIGPGVEACLALLERSPLVLPRAGAEVGSAEERGDALPRPATEAA